jgi:predicted RNA-binding Zn-ribbon protein involved in translation (DUF1610 family)
MEADSNACPSCGVDLSIFDLDQDGNIDFDNLTIEDSKSLDDLLEEITASDEISSDIVEDIATIGKEGTTVVDGDVEAEDKETPGKKSESDGIPEVPEPEHPPDPDEVGFSTEAKEKEVDDGAEDDAGEEEVFECPSCNSPLPASSPVCPECGVEFVEEEVVQFQCPECSTIITGESNKCPKCGAVFEEDGVLEAAEAPIDEISSNVKKEIEESIDSMTKEGILEGEATLVGADGKPADGEAAGKEADEGDPYQRLQELVEDVKPLLLIAKRYDIDVSKGKELINKAILSGKKKDTKSALEHITKSKKVVESALTDQISGLLDKLVAGIDEAKNSGIEIDVGARLDESRDALKRSDFESSIQSYLRAKETYETFSIDYIKARENLEFVEEIIKNSEFLNFDVSEGLKSVTDIKKAIEKRNWLKAAKVAGDAKTSVLDVLNTQIQGEIKKARSVLIDWKSKKVDISKPMGYLKEASIALKNDDLSEALKYLTAFKRETAAL